MRKIIYYIATSLDGFIAGENDDVSGFIYTGDGVETYLNDLKSFDTVIMGRSTYEFGYKFGAIPGEPSPAYPHMKHFIFSNNLTLDNLSDQVQIKKIDLNEIHNLKNQEGSDIYLCGGGQFAGWLLDNKQIDILKIKVNPLILNRGTKLFGESKGKYKLQLLESKNFEHGLQISSYQIIYD